MQIKYSLLHNCLCLIEICAYPHVTIKQLAVVNYEIEVMFKNNLIFKAVDST